MSHTALLATHVVAGTLGLLLGPLVMYRQSRRLHRGLPPADRLWQCYVLLVVLVAVTAVLLVATNRAELWWLIPVSLLTVALMVLAGESMRRRYAGWLHGYTHGLGGSYISLVTAFIVVALTVDGPVTGTAQLVPWLAPTLVGVVGIELWRRRLDRAMRSGRLTG